MKVRVLNKTKDNVTYTVIGLKIPPNTTTWEDFNKMMKPTSDPFIFESDPEVDKQAKERIAMLQEIFPFMLAGRVSVNKGGMPDMTNVAMLGSISQKYCEKFNCSIIDFINDYRMFEKATLESMQGMGVGIGKVHRDYHGIKGHDTRREREPQPNPITPDSDKCSIGDMIKAKQEQKRK